MSESINYSIQDFSLVNSYVKKAVEDFNLKTTSNGFYFFILDVLLGLQDDEIRDSITDSFYLQTVSLPKGHDRGIDAVYIDTSSNKPTIHFFNCKYSDNFDKVKSNHFPSTEIDKILSFISSLMAQDANLKNDINSTLFSKVKEIWEIFKTENPNFVIHMCSNLYQGLEQNERARFEREINKNSNFKIKYHTIIDFVNLLNNKDRKIVDGKIRAIKKELFEKSDGDVRALIANLSGREIIRLVLDDENIRNTVDTSDYRTLRDYPILEDAFADNVRIYQKQRTRINRNIKETALSDENSKFFYYNNGITIICDHFEYAKTQSYPIIELKNLQIVNGCQTIHALYDALLENFEQLETVDILCRIYEIRRKKLSTDIAEYTNSQNPVKSRDIRSIDFVQQKLEKEFLTKGIYYERKKGQFSDRPKKNRIDSEKIGQVLMAFYNQMPSEAKNNKSLIFAEKYEEVFNDTITVDKALLPYNIYERIEAVKESKKSVLENTETYERDSFILHASYYILYLLSEIAKLKSINLDLKNLDNIWGLYDDALKVIGKIIKNEQSISKEKYNHASFFKSNKPKLRFEEFLSEENLNELAATLELDIKVN